MDVMGGKAHHPSSSDSDYWGDESWIVDCPCGVSFDDGEEMVECDECGVWVHTACCRAHKGLSTFVCDKCKSKKKQEKEEASEVLNAAVAAAAAADAHGHAHPPSNLPEISDLIHKSNDTPISDRVHVQGMVGGDPSMFAGVSKVFSQQLWKATGYVPKVFQLNTHDLPIWPHEEDIPESLLHLLGTGKEVGATFKHSVHFLKAILQSLL